MERITDSVAVIILAAGLGTRMKSNKAKVLHELMGRSMILYVVETAARIVGCNVTLVVGHQAEEVKAIVSKVADVAYAYQDRQLGTAHAVRTALPIIPQTAEEIIILYGDVPLLTTDTIRRLLEYHHAERNDITVLGVEIENPTGYGRILHDERGRVLRIVEEADASPEEKQIRSVNTGIYCIKKACLEETITAVSADNAQGEYYLTDIIEIGNRMGKTIGTISSDHSDEVMGINTLEELATAERLMCKRLGKTA